MGEPGIGESMTPGHVYTTRVTICEHIFALQYPLPRAMPLARLLAVAAVATVVRSCPCPPSAFVKEPRPRVRPSARSVPLYESLSKSATPLN